MVKHTQTIRQLSPMNCLNAFDHFEGLPLKGLITPPKSYKKKYFRGPHTILLIQKIFKPFSCNRNIS